MTNGKKRTPYYQAQAILSIRDHSLYELKAKLKKRRFSTEEITTVLERLKKENLVDDHRFAKLFIESTLRRKAVGPWYLTAKLRQRGVDENIIQSVLAAYNNAGKEQELAHKAAHEWHRAHRDRKQDLVKLGRFLAGRGFRQEVITGCISTAAATYFREDV